jgi:hypothetical protein
VYVDDLIIMGTKTEAICEFKAQMQKQFKMSHLGLLTYYWGSRCVSLKVGSLSVSGATPTRY